LFACKLYIILCVCAKSALVPSSRGYIEFTVAPQALDGIQEYSHVWIIFEFHANTNILQDSRKTKIQPPRAPIKVGHLATRSPHRPNQIGLSLVKVQGVKGNRVYISALDLVNGTPVYDIKPCVPWDVVGFYNAGDTLKVPQWVVSQEDALPQVEFEQTASDALQELMDNNVSPVYGKSDFELVQKAIQEILAQDPRSGLTRGSADTKKPYNVMFGSVQVQFVVEASGTVRVVKVQSIKFPDNAYVDGIPLASELDE
jgi:tRNA-Thr(GGU) m(6)t(6)A37 methyltransferase TsaA